MGKHAAFAPIHLGDTHWSVCVATPESELLVLTGPLRPVPVAAGNAGAAVHGLQRHPGPQAPLCWRRRCAAAKRPRTPCARAGTLPLGHREHFRRVLPHGRPGASRHAQPSGLALGGYTTEEEVLGKPAAAFWRNPARRDTPLALLERDGLVRDFEVELLDKDGKAVLAATSSSFYRDHDGRILGVQGTFRDISQR